MKISPEVFLISDSKRTQNALSFSHLYLPLIAFLETLSCVPVNYANASTLTYHC